MIIPLKVLNSFIEEGYTFLYANPKFDTEKSEHFHVALNLNPSDAETFYFVCASSQVKKVTRRTKYGVAKETIVKTTPKECGIFNKDTVFDCNTVYSLPREVLEKGIDIGLIKYKGTVPKTLFEQIRAGVKKSKIVENEIKKKLGL